MSLKAIGSVTLLNVDDGSQGEQGLSVSKVATQYYLSTSPSSLSGGSWVNTQPEVTAGTYLWERTKTTLSDNSVVYSSAVYAQTISGLVSDVDNVKGQITDKVWQSDITSSINSYDSSTVSTIRDRVTTTEQNISGITTRVSDVESTTSSLGTRLTSAESSITQNADNIELKVSKDSVISAINQSAESITISADKVNIAGSTSFTSLSNQVTAIQNKADKNADIIANWATDATSSTTTINGGLIQTHTIESTHLATDAIMSNNFQASQNINSPYSVAGSFLDLTNGNFYTPNFGLDNVNGNAYFNGEITATSGQIGDDTSNHWQIGTVVDFNGNQSAAIKSNGTSYIQSGDWMISNNRIDTRHYDNQRKYTYLYEDGVYWDFGLHTPSLTSNNEYENNFIYIRNHESTIPTLEGAWNYIFRVDRNGMIYINGVSLDDKYASIDGVDGTYLPLTGGSLSGNLSVGGNLTVTGTVNGLKTLTINGKTYNGSANVNVGVIGASYGGTGESSLNNSANALINALPEGTGTPTDNMYYIGQKADGTTNVYYRKPVTTLWTYIQNKITADTSFLDAVYVPKTGGEFTGAVTVSDNLIADGLTTGSLIVNGVGRFVNGIYGNLIGTIGGYTVESNVPSGAVFTDTTYTFANGTNGFTVTPSGGSAQTIKVTPSVADVSASASGLMTSALYTKLDGISTGATATSFTRSLSSGTKVGTITIDGTSTILYAPTNTTYTFASGTNGFTVTPSGGTAQTITVTPSIADVTQSTSGLMSASDKTILDNIAANFSGGTITVSNVTASNGLTYNYDSTTGITAITGTYPITTSTGTQGQVLIADSNGKGAWNDQSALIIKRLDSKYGNTSASKPTTANIASSSDRIGSLEIFNATSVMTEGKPSSDGHILHMNWYSTSGYDSQLYIPNSNTTNSAKHPQWRTMNKGTWTDWVYFLDANNFNSYAPTLTGTGASGTWGIDISGNAGTATTAGSATKATQDGNGNVITSTYLPLSGGTMTGQIITTAGTGSWLTAATNAAIRSDVTSGYNALTSQKTKNGRITIGTLPSSDDRWYLTYIDDSRTENGRDGQLTWNPSTNTLSANLDGNATKDGDGNIITSYYVTLSTDQTISGEKTFSSVVTFANNRWNLFGDDVYVGDCNANGRIGIKGKNANTGIRLVPYSGSTNVDITTDGNGNTTITENLIQTGTITVGSHAKMTYNSTLSCLEFSFV